MSRPIFRMSLDQRDAIEKEVAGFFRRRPGGYGGGTQAGVVGLCMQAMDRRGQAELDRKVAQEALVAMEEERDEWRASYDEVAEYLEEYVQSDGKPGPTLAAHLSEIDDLKTENRLLTSQIKAKESRVRWLEGELERVNQQKIATAAKSSGLASISAADLTRMKEKVASMEEKVTRLEDQLDRENKARRDAERAKVVFDIERSTMQGIIDELQERPVINYHPPVHLDLSDPEVMRKELDRLSHNDSVSRYAAEFYERRHDLTEERLKDLKDEVHGYRLCHRIELRKKEEEITALRRRLEGSKDDDDRCRWTKYEREGFLGLPLKEPSGVQERHSCPPVVVLTRSVDIESVYFKILDPLPGQDLDVERMLDACVRW